MTSSSPQDTSRRLLTLMIIINQIKQNSVIMRIKLSADTNNTEPRAVPLFLITDWRLDFTEEQTLR